MSTIVPMTYTIRDEVYQDYVGMLLAGNRTGCAAIVHRLMDDNPPLLTLYLDLFQRSLYEVGELWAAHRISVATEHMATAITEGLLNRIFPLVPSRHRVGRQVTVAGPQPELHQVGGRMVADVFEMHGWDSCYVGANTPVEELMAMLREDQPHLLALSLTIPDNLPAFQDTLERIGHAFPDLPVLIGGRALQVEGEKIAAASRHVTYFPSLEHLDSYLLTNGQG